MANIEQCVEALKKGDVIAYPTESVFGLGCDPDDEEAIKKLLAIKHRDKAKGLILVAADFSQLANYVDLELLSDEALSKIKATWPGPVTWVVPCRSNVSTWVTGEFSTIAVRVSDHPDVQALCRAYGKPITSTSANLAGFEPYKTFDEVRLHLGQKVESILEGVVGGREKPTEIRDAASGAVIRQS